MAIHDRIWDENYHNSIDVEEIAGGAKFTFVTNDDDAHETVINAAQCRKLRLMLTRMEKKQK